MFSSVNHQPVYLPQPEDAMRFRALALSFVVLMSTASYGQQNPAAPPDAIFFNGKVITVDADFGIKEAFAVKGETFAAVGTNDRIRALAGRATRLIDLRGAAVIPGLTDNHDHV